jgi:integrase
MFLTVWKKYLMQVAQVERNHPYAFINLEDGTVGAPYKQRQYEKAHARACQRIGLEVKKELGTTTQGHRHAYGRRLVKGGVSKDFIRKFMHHSSIESQGVYTTPSPAEVKDVLKNADEKLKAAYPSNGYTSDLFRD